MIQPVGQPPRRRPSGARFRGIHLAPQPRIGGGFYRRRQFVKAFAEELIEPAGAAGLAGLRTLAPKLEGKRVGIVLSGANVDSTTLQRVLSGEL